MFKFLEELLARPTVKGKTFTEEEKDLIDKLVNQISEVSKKKFTINKFIQDEEHTYGRYRSSTDSIGGIYKERFRRLEVTEIIQYDLILGKYRFDLRFDRIHSDNKDTELEYGLDVIGHPMPAKPWIFIWVWTRDHSSIGALSDIKIFIANDSRWKERLEDEISSIFKEINKRLISYLK